MDNAGLLAMNVEANWQLVYACVGWVEQGVSGQPAILKIVSSAKPVCRHSKHVKALMR